MSYYTTPMLKAARIERKRVGEGREEEKGKKKNLTPLLLPLDTST